MPLPQVRRRSQFGKKLLLVPFDIPGEIVEDILPALLLLLSGELRVGIENFFDTHAIRFRQKLHGNNTTILKAIFN